MRAVRARSTASSRSSATPPTPRSMTKPTRTGSFCSTLVSALPCPADRFGLWSRRNGAPEASTIGRAEPAGTRWVHAEPARRGLHQARAVTTGAKEPQVRPPAQPPPGTTSGGGPEFKSPHRLPRAVRALGHEAVDHPWHASAHVGSDGLCRKFILRVGAGHRGQLPVSARHELRGPPSRGRLRGAPRHG